MKQQHNAFNIHILYVLAMTASAFGLIPFNVTAQSNTPVADFTTAPTVQWKQHTNQPLIASPVIDNNNVFVGGLDSILYSIDLPSGKINWKFRTGGEIRSNVLISGNQLFLAGGDGIFYAIDKITGKLSWRYVFNKTALFLGERKYDLADYYTASPVLANNILYFGSGDGRINALRAQNGQLVWTYATNDIVHATPAVDNNTVFAGSFDGNLYALNAMNGNLLWKFKSVGHEYFPKGEMQSNPIVFNGRVFIGARDFNLYAIDVNTGNAHWNQKFPKGWAYGNAIHDSVLYVGTSEDKFIAAMDPATGKEKWRANTIFNIFGPPAFSNSMLYVGNLMGKIFAIDSKTGAIRWTFVTDGYTANHDTYFKADDSFRDDLYKYIKNNVDYINAQLKWGAVFSSPAVSGDYMVITSTDGTIYCLKNGGK